MRIQKNTLILLVVVLFIFSACKDTWKDHDKTSADAEGTIMDKISQQSELTTFAGLLVKTGYDKLLVSSKAFTVWAPNNEALAAVNQSVLADTAQLRKLVANHIAFETFLSQTSDTLVRIQMVGGKMIYYHRNSKSIGSAAITTADILSGNGALHIINKALLPQANLWESLFLSSQTAAYTNYINKLYFQLFDTANSKKIGVNVSNGKYIYDTVRVKINYYLTKVADLRVEKNEYTCFVLTDNAFSALNTQFKTYYKITNSAGVEMPAKTDSVTNWQIASDMVFSGKYSTLPDTLVSINGTKIAVDRSAIVESFDASNGKVYVMSNCPILLKNKIRPILIEGESSGRILPATEGFSAYTINQVRINPNASGKQDVFVSVHKTQNFSFDYKITINSCNYNIYWVAQDSGRWSTPNRNYVYPLQKFGLYRNDVSVTTWNIDALATIPPITTIATTQAYTRVNVLTAGNYAGGVYSSIAYGLVTVRAISYDQNTDLSLDYILLTPVLP